MNGNYVNNTAIIAAVICVTLVMSAVMPIPCDVVAAAVCRT
jgi:hypothetical protein